MEKLFVIDAELPVIVEKPFVIDAKLPVIVEKLFVMAAGLFFHEEERSGIGAALVFLDAVLAVSDAELAGIDERAVAIEPRITRMARMDWTKWKRPPAFSCDDDSAR